MAQTVKDLILETINDPTSYLGKGSLYVAFRLRIEDRNYVLRVDKNMLDIRYDDADGIMAITPKEQLLKQLDALPMRSTQTIMDGVRIGQTLMHLHDDFNYMPAITINPFESGVSLKQIENGITNRLKGEGLSGLELKNTRNLEMVKLLSRYQGALRGLFQNVIDSTALDPYHVMGDYDWGNILLDQKGGRFSLIDQNLGHVLEPAAYTDHAKGHIASHITRLASHLVENAKDLSTYKIGNVPFVKQYIAKVRDYERTFLNELKTRETHPARVGLRKVESVDMAPATTPPHALLEQLKILDHSTAQSSRA